MSGGAGYVLSRRALDDFVKKALPNGTLCKKEDTGAEDVEIGKCLENVHVVAGDSRDSEGRETFMPFDPLVHLKMKKPTKPDWWYWTYIFYPSKEVSLNYI